MSYSSRFRCRRADSTVHLFAPSGSGRAPHPEVPFHTETIRPGLPGQSVAADHQIPLLILLKIIRRERFFCLSLGYRPFPIPVYPTVFQLILYPCHLTFFQLFLPDSCNCFRKFSFPLSTLPATLSLPGPSPDYRPLRKVPQRSASAQASPGTYHCPESATAVFPVHPVRGSRRFPSPAPGRRTPGLPLTGVQSKGSLSPVPH